MKHLKTVLKLLFSAAVMIALFGCGGSGSNGKGSSVKLVDFTGMTKLDVETWINENSVDREKVFYTYESSETVPQDKIISQSVLPGEELGDNSLTIVISTGVDPDTEITFVNFSEMSLEEIQQWFINEHFEHVSVQYVYDTNYPIGSFVATIPAEKARRTDTVIVQISGDPGQAGLSVKMPSMAGWTKQQAEEWANTNQVSISYSTQHSTTVAENIVISTDPKSGDEVMKGSVIQVTYSLGATVTAISLAGKSRNEIDAWGNENGIQISWLQCWNRTASGTVYGNEPNSGTMRMGDVMKVYVSVGPIPVKDYTGLSYQNNFLGWLNSINSQYYSTANLKVSVSEKETTDKESGTILSQTPNSGYINPNSTIQLVIAKKVSPAPTPTPDPRINIPSMTGYSEFDFKHALHAYGVVEGTRTEMYSSSIAKDYIISNDTGLFMPQAPVNYVVSLGQFVLNPYDWEGKNYNELEVFVASANRLGAGVKLDQTYVDDGDWRNDNHISQIWGPSEDNTYTVRCSKYRGLIVDSDGDGQPDGTE